MNVCDAFGCTPSVAIQELALAPRAGRRLRALTNEVTEFMLARSLHKRATDALDRAVNDANAKSQKAPESVDPGFMPEEGTFYSDLLRYARGCRFCSALPETKKKSGEPHADYCPVELAGDFPKSEVRAAARRLMAGA